MLKTNLIEVVMKKGMKLFSILNFVLKHVSGEIERENDRVWLDSRRFHVNNVIVYLDKGERCVGS